MILNVCRGARGDLGQSDDLHPGHYWLCCGPGQCLEVPIPGSEKWRRWWNTQTAQITIHLLSLGAFLIPYVFALFFLGLPLFILELAIGQRLRKGSIGVWKQVGCNFYHHINYTLIQCAFQISPYLGGLGLASGVVAFNVALYYNTIIAWCLKYFVQV